MSVADLRIRARSCFELARVTRCEKERRALRDEGARFTSMAEQGRIAQVVG